MDAASLLFASSIKCYTAIETKLGNPQGKDKVTAENCCHCLNCLGTKLYVPVDKTGLKTILFDILFVSAGPNQNTERHTPKCVWDRICSYPNS